MKRILLSLLFVLFCVPCVSSNAAVWYVRTDGGTATQCTGLTNAAFPGGTGTGLNCAVNHPFWLLNYAGNWLIAGGDTVQFEDVGPYYMGETLNGIGQDWTPFIGNCAYGANCVLPPLPSGTAASPTRLLGANAGACHTAAHTGTQGATQLVGLNAAFWIITTIGSVNPDVECFDLSQPDQCTSAGYNFLSPSQRCGTGTNNFAAHGLMLSYLTSAGPSNATFKDLSIHGLANEGITGGKMNLGASDVTTFNDIYIIGNGMAGFNSDSGGCDTSCESQGTINMNHWVVNWNGCMEVKPNGGTPGGNGFAACADQSHSGYGDGFSMIATGGTWNIADVSVNWNTQDGFDGLHMGDDHSSNPIVNLTRISAQGNMGQQVKMGGNITETNSWTIGNCSRLGHDFAPNPVGYNTFLGDFCRGGSIETLVQLLDGRYAHIENVTSAGYSGTMWGFSSVQNFPCTGKCTVVFKNNLNVGFPDPDNSNIVSAGMYFDTDSFDVGEPFSNPGSAIDHNLWFNMRDGTCPQDPTYETNSICADPKLVNELTTDSVNPALTAGSPAIGKGVYLPTVLTDYNLATRSNPPAIGYAEYSSGTTVVTPPVTTPVTPPTTPVTPPVTTPVTPPSTVLATPVVALTVTPNPASFGQSVTFTATVSAASGTPTGTVTLMNGSTTLGTASLVAGVATYSTSALPAATYAVSVAYGGDTKFAAGTSAATSLVVSSAKTIAVTVGQPQFGFNVVPGATRRLFANVTNGTTNQILWSVISGTATLSSTSGSWVDVVAPATGSACSYVNTNGTYAVNSATKFTIEATSVEDSTKKADITFNVCNPSVSVSVVPFYRTLYANQSADVQSLVTGTVNQNVQWAISSQPIGGDGKLGDTTSRDTVFSASVAGRYTLTSTSQADTSKVTSAVLYVTGNTMPYTNPVTPNYTEPVDCSVDPLMGGRVYEVGPSQAFHTLASVPFPTMAAGSTVRLHNEDTTGLHPTEYHEFVQIMQQGGPLHPTRLCGVPDSLGHLPIVDGSEATGRIDASVTIAGMGVLTVHSDNSSKPWPAFTTPGYLVVEGIHFRNAKTGYTYKTASGATAPWGDTSACVRINQGQNISFIGDDFDNCGTGAMSAWNPSGGWGAADINVLWEGNHIHNNGIPGSSAAHQMDLQAWGEIVQFNRIDNAAAGSLGANIKSRGLQGVIRYNFLGDGPGRQMDLVDVKAAAPYMSFAGFLGGGSASYHAMNAQDSYPADMIAAQQEAWNLHYVYGNIYQNSRSMVPIHFSMDTAGGELSRKGSLYWYNNTFYQKACPSCGTAWTLFDTTAGNGTFMPQTEFPTVQSFNNVIWMDNPASPTFQWNNYSAFIGVSGKNLLPTSWGTNNLAGGAGSGWNASTTTDAYQNSTNLAAHLTGFTSTNLATVSSIPFDPTSWVLNSDVAGNASVPSGVCEMPARFAYLPNLGYAVARIATPNVGATDTSAEMGTQMTSLRGPSRGNTHYSNCR